MSVHVNQRTDIDRAFEDAQEEIRKAERLQPGEYLVHSNDVQGIINNLQSCLHCIAGIKEQA